MVSTLDCSDWRVTASAKLHIQNTSHCFNNHLLPRILKSGNGGLRRSSQGQIDICIKVPKFPGVTHGKELCKPYLELLMHGKELCKPYLQLLMGKNYASLTLSYSWEGFMQNTPPVTLGKELCNTCFA